MGDERMTYRVTLVPDAYCVDVEADDIDAAMRQAEAGACGFRAIGAYGPAEAPVARFHDPDPTGA